MAPNRKETPAVRDGDPWPAELNISADKVCYIVLNARELGVSSLRLRRRDREAPPMLLRPYSGVRPEASTAR
jgi:hypothetical protein